MATTVFYSWQSDLPSGVSRGLIMDSIVKALSRIASDTTVDQDPRLDKDTEGVPGSPDIAQTIFQKIDGAEAFVCDVSVVSENATSRTGGQGRATPNPNVLVELGYAIRALGWDRVVMVMNTAYGQVELLPFDLRSKRVLTYRALPSEVKTTTRDQLASQFEVALRTIFAYSRRSEVDAFTAGVSSAMTAIEDAAPNAQGKLVVFLRGLLDKLNSCRPKPGGTSEDEGLVNALDATTSLVHEFARVAGCVALHDASTLAPLILHEVSHLLDSYDRPPRPDVTWTQADSDYFRFVGNELFVVFVQAMLREERFEVLSSLLVNQFSIDTNHGRQSMNFSAFSEHCPLLSGRSERLARESKARSKPISLHANILKERHSSGDLASSSPFDEYIQADHFLFLRSELHPALSPTLNHERIWVPQSYVYMRWTVPEFFERARAREYAGRLCRALGLSNVEEFRSRMVERHVSVQALSSSTNWHLRTPWDPKQIGTD